MAIVIGAGALHAIWNAIAKYLDDRLVVFALIGVASTVGGGLMLAVAGLPVSEMGRYFNDGQMEARATALKAAYKIARQIVVDVSR